MYHLGEYDVQIGKLIVDGGIAGIYAVTLIMGYKLLNRFLTALIHAVKENSAALAKLSEKIEALGRPADKEKPRR